MNEALLDIIEQEPIYHDSSETICPKCDSTNVKTLDVTHTLVGGEPDPNHYWRLSYCRDCESNFTHEHKKDNHWYTENIDGVGTFVLRGVANCFENYVYTCNKCPGYVKRFYTELDGITPLTSGLLSYGVEDGTWAPKQREFWGCVICDNKIETTEPARKVDTGPKVLEGWKVVEEVGDSYYDAQIIPLLRTFTPSKHENDK